MASSSLKTRIIPTKDTVRSSKRIKLDSLVNGPADDPPNSPPVDSSTGDLPFPFGSPPAWSDDRQPLCETLEYYRSYQGSAYCHDGICYGFLVDFIDLNHYYMDEEIIIVRAGGSCEMTDGGARQQTQNQTAKSAQVPTFLRNQREYMAIVVILGSRPGLTPSIMPHRYNVGAHFHVTAVWSEMNGAHVVFMFRLQKVNLLEKSWWAPMGSPMPSASPDYHTKAPRFDCPTCGEVSPQIYNEGWICVSHKGCPDLGKLNGQDQPARLTFSRAFLNERTEWPAGVAPTYELAPSALENDPLNKYHSTSLAAWKGFVCPQCKRCNSRIDWNWETCQTQGCGYKRRMYHPVQSHIYVLPDHTREIQGHAPSQDEYRGHVPHPTLEFLGHWKVCTYKLCEDNYITHFMANKHINARLGGANDMFLELQNGEGVGLKRPYMKSCKGDTRSSVDETLCEELATKGMPYNYIAAAESAPFSEAPKAIMECLNRLTWAGNVAVKGKSYPPRNELLAVGYMETQKMNYHDDGEKMLDDLVATWSLGGTAEMCFRIKKNYAHPMLNEASYNPNQEVIMGSDFWEERTRLNTLYARNLMDAYEAEKAKLFNDLRGKNKSKGKQQVVAAAEEGESDPIDTSADIATGKKGSLMPWCLRLYLRHGDFVVMHGAKIHTAYEHAVVPHGKLRFGMTARYVKPELIPTDQHYRGEFTIADEDLYSGDLDLPFPTQSITSAVAT